MHIIAFACCPKVLNHSALCDAELFGDSVGCQSAGRQEHAISLTIAQHSLGPWGCNTGNALCCRQRHGADAFCHGEEIRSEEHTSELQSLMRITYAAFCLKKKEINSHTEIHADVPGHAPCNTTPIIALP